MWQLVHIGSDNGLTTYKPVPIIGWFTDKNASLSFTELI